MSRFECSLQNAVRKAAAAGAWEPGLRDHAAACPVCRDVALVAGALNALTPESHPLPDPRRIWWRAQWLRSREAERAAWPILLWSRFATAGAILVVALCVISLWNWLPSSEGQWSLFGLNLPVLALAASVAAVTGLAVLFALRAALAED